MQLYKCLQDDKILTEKAIARKVCLGHSLISYNEEPEQVLKVAIGIPTEGHTLPESYDNHLVSAMRLGGLQERWRYEKRCPRYEFYWYTTGRLLTQMAREKLMKVALEAEMDYIVMFDDDMILPQDMIVRLLEDMEQRPEIDVLGTLAFMRNPPHYPVLYLCEEGYDAVRHVSYYRNEAYPDYPKETIVECDAVGFGAVCIRMSMVRKMKEPYFMSTTPTGEDIFFCVNARRQAKARVFMDTRIKLGHLANPVIVDEEYFQKWTKEHKWDVPKRPPKYAVDSDDIRHPLLELDR